jgi:hypothetical protein
MYRKSARSKHLRIGEKHVAQSGANPMYDRELQRHEKLSKLLETFFLQLFKML